MAGTTDRDSAHPGQGAIATEVRAVFDQARRRDPEERPAFLDAHYVIGIQHVYYNICHEYEEGRDPRKCVHLRFLPDLVLATVSNPFSPRMPSANP